MTFSVLHGRLGSGKSKAAVNMARRYLRQGRRVASNVDMYLDKMLPPGSRATYVRVPDKPTVDDLEHIGHGNPESYDEDENGLLLLDELGSWLNARTYQDKGRQAVLDWLIHSRKRGWDVVFICQNLVQIDKQVRESFVEYSIACLNWKKIRIPVVGGLLNTIFGKRAGYFPAFHTATTRMVLPGDPRGIQMARDIFNGRDLHGCYDTRQVFDAAYPHGAQSLLSAWHLVGRHQPAAEPKLRQAAAYVAEVLHSRPAPRPRPPGRPDLAELLALVPAELRDLAARELAAAAAAGELVSRHRLALLVADAAQRQGRAPAHRAAAARLLATFGT